MTTATASILYNVFMSVDIYLFSLFFLQTYPQSNADLPYERITSGVTITTNQAVGVVAHFRVYSGVAGYRQQVGPGYISRYAVDLKPVCQAFRKLAGQRYRFQLDEGRIVYIVAGRISIGA